LELRSILSFLSRRWWFLVLGALIAGMTAYFFTRSMTPVYEATASILVVNQAPVDRPGVPGTEPGTLSDILINDRLMKTYVELVDRPIILEVVSQRLDRVYSSGDLGTKVSVSNRPLDTQILQISVKDSSPGQAALIANTTAQAFIEENEREIGRPGTVSIAQAARPPSAPVAPRVGMYTAFAMFLGLVVAATYARGLDYLDDTVKTPDDVTTAVDLPTLGVIGKAGESSIQRALGRMSGRAMGSHLIEDVRELRERVLFISLDSDLKTLAVVSENPDEGGTTTAVRLAEVMAEAGEQVVLVDANLRRPRLHETYEVSNAFGLTGFLTQQQDVYNMPLMATKIKNLRLLPAGPIPVNPADLLASARMTRTIQRLKESGSYVIFDTLPLSSGSDALILAGRVDGSLPVVRAGAVRAQDLSHSIDRLRQARANILGIVLNHARSSGPRTRESKSAAFEGKLSDLLRTVSESRGGRRFSQGKDVRVLPAERASSDPPGSV